MAFAESNGGNSWSVMGGAEYGSGLQLPWMLKSRGSKEAMEVLPRIPKGSKEDPFPKAESKGGAGVGLNNPEVRLRDCSNVLNCWTSACMVVGGISNFPTKFTFNDHHSCDRVHTENEKHCPGEA